MASPACRPISTCQVRAFGSVCVGGWYTVTIRMELALTVPMELGIWSDCSGSGWPVRSPGLSPWRYSHSFF